MTLSILSLSTYALAADDSEPVLVLLEKDPWLDVIGSDSPSFALYDDGRVIFKQAASDKKAGYRYADLSKQQFENLLSKLDLENSFSSLKDNYELSSETDQITQQFYIKTKDKVRILNVYGSLHDSSVRLIAPKAITALFDTLTSYNLPKSEQWMPTKIEVMIGPYDYAPDKSIIWPSNWPDLNSPDTKKRHHGSYSLYVDSNLFKDLEKFLSTRHQKGAVEINGKKWSASIRFPFPQEKKWMSATH